MTHSRTCVLLWARGDEPAEARQVAALRAHTARPHQARVPQRQTLARLRGRLETARIQVVSSRRVHGRQPRRDAASAAMVPDRAATTMQSGPEPAARCTVLNDLSALQFSMTSVALDDWLTKRQPRLEQLREAHEKVGGKGAGRRWRTEQLNYALVMRIAGEFQGFCRDLHDETTDYFVPEAVPHNLAAQTILSGSLTLNRVLDRGNASPGGLGNDFLRFGIQLWPSLYVRWPGNGPRWNQSLEALNKLRNGIAHAQDDLIREVSDDGWPPAQLKTADRFRANAEGLAAGMDTVMASYLQALFGGAKPW